MMFQGPLPENRKLAGTAFVIFSYASSDIMIKFESEPEGLNLKRQVMAIHV